MNHCNHRIAVFLATLFLFTLPACTGPADSAELTLTAAQSALKDATEIRRRDQLPHSRTTRGSRHIAAVWLAGPTDRYPHGVLGDELEASRLVADTANGRQLTMDLPTYRVFEDLMPRLVDLDADGEDEILVVESDVARGASLAVYGVEGQHLVKIAATPFLGIPNRWLNPLGVGDFDGDGRLDIALVATPHIGGRLRLYQFNKEGLSPFAEYKGVSTHRIGSTELGLGQVVPARPRDRLLVPDQSRRKLMLLEWTPDGWRTIAGIHLPAALASSLRPLGRRQWQFRLADESLYNLRLTD